MDARTIEIVQTSWQQLLKERDSVVERFYQKLFELNPSTRALFPEDPAVLGRKLMMLLNVAVIGLHDLDALEKLLYSLGAQHSKYGVREEHYEHVGEALLFSLANSPGVTFTPELKGAWRAVYQFAAATMQQPAPSPKWEIPLYSIHLVQESWMVIQPHSKQLVTHFRDKWFELDSAAELLFRRQGIDWGRKFTAALGLMINRLGNMKALRRELEELAHRHVIYGVKAAQYALFCEALIWSLERVDGELFTAETRSAWEGILSLFATVMTQATDN